eukprot:TRINITY_DN11107_c0_g1_i1.p1 TRINITY_DN11107_c0_g1~~TRINITY_DN11107_c0_g1_i1.p1  ORF type:complete len:168 (+),score=22.30 TRINITY_DN11107_c0_g1_i1:167-670(+)
MCIRDRYLGDGSGAVTREGALGELCSAAMKTSTAPSLQPSSQEEALASLSAVCVDERAAIDQPSPSPVVKTVPRMVVPTSQLLSQVRRLGSVCRQSRSGQKQHQHSLNAVSYTHLRAHETVLDLVCRLLLEKKKKRIFTETPSNITLPYNIYIILNRLHSYKFYCNR